MWEIRIGHVIHIWTHDGIFTDNDKKIRNKPNLSRSVA